MTIVSALTVVFLFRPGSGALRPLRWRGQEGWHRGSRSARPLKGRALLFRTENRLGGGKLDGRTHFPPLAEVPSGSLIPLWRELPADLETPASAYLKLRREGTPSFLLESVEKGEWLGRCSFLGTAPAGLLIARDDEVVYEEPMGAAPPLRAHGDPLVLARQILNRYRPVDARLPLPRFYGGLVGYLAYDATRLFEKVPLASRPGLGLPDAVFMLVNDLIVFDHARHQLLVIAGARVDDDARKACWEAAERIERLVALLERPLPEVPRYLPESTEEPGPPWESNFSQAAFEDTVRRAKEYIAAGDIFQVVLSQRFSRTTPADPFSIYRTLRMLNPSPICFFWNSRATST